MLRATLTLVAVCLPLGAAGGELPANSWTPVEMDWKAALPAEIGGASWTTGDGYSDNTCRTKTGNVLIRTGIHSRSAGYSPGFYTNTTVEWDLATDTLKWWETANWSGGSYGNGKPLPAYKEHPTPTPRHTYDGICYVPEADEMYLLFGAYGRMKGGKNPSPEGRQLIDADANYTWKFSFATRRWTRIDNSPKSIGVRVDSLYEQHLAYWAAGGRLLYTDSHGRSYAEFDLEKGRWQKAEVKNKCPQSLYHARSTWDTKRDLWVFRLGPWVCTFDPRERTFAGLPNCWDMEIPEDREARKKMKVLKWKGVCYVSKHDCYLVTGQTGNDTRVYHVGEGKWRKLAAGDLELVNGYCQYNQELDLVAMNYQQKCYKLKYVPQNAKSEGP